MLKELELNANLHRAVTRVSASHGSVCSHMQTSTNPIPKVDASWAPNTERGPIRLGIYLTQKFPLVPVSLVFDALRIANEIAGERLFSHMLLTSEDAAVVSSCNFPAPFTDHIDDCPTLDVLLICSGETSFGYNEPRVLHWLRRIYHSGTIVGGVSSGSLLMARAGLLDNRPCAVHWASVEAMRENFYRVIVTDRIFCVDGRVITCAGGVSTLDMMLYLIERLSGRQLALKLADALIYPVKRGGDEPARNSPAARTGTKSRQLVRSVELMENHIESPISINEMGQRVGASVRHLERLFSHSFGLSPSQYYMRLRLEAAHDLLVKTDLQIVEVAMRCGFCNASHFTRRYSDAYKQTPSVHRRANG